MRAVCNSSPLIFLAKIGRIRILPQLYGELIIPSSVLKEIEMKPGKEVEEIHKMVASRQFQLHRASEEALNELPIELGTGEREAIALTLETKADLVILDDQQGRTIARYKGLSTTGTIGVLIEARERRLITSLRREMDHLVEVGMWIDEKFYHRVLKEYGE